MLLLASEFCLALGDEWVKKADMPTARITPKTAVVNEKIYAIGGGSKNIIQLKTTEMYDLTNDSWQKS
jgi:N-acetylneuraminic acid mutarotase